MAIFFPFRNSGKLECIGRLQPGMLGPVPCFSPCFNFRAFSNRTLLIVDQIVHQGFSIHLSHLFSPRHSVPSILIAQQQLLFFSPFFLENLLLCLWHLQKKHELKKELTFPRTWQRQCDFNQTVIILKPFQIKLVTLSSPLQPNLKQNRKPSKI